MQFVLNIDNVTRLLVHLICIAVVDMRIVAGIGLKGSGGLGHESLSETSNSAAVQLNVSQPAAKPSLGGFPDILRHSGDGGVRSRLPDLVALAKSAPLVVHLGRLARRGKFDFQIGTAHRLQGLEGHVQLRFESPQGFVLLSQRRQPPRS
eukprot:CCRYP_006923-RB/>CCRYP_006923-RB protein AED:0.47 eAED:1.00 QI:0/0/0/1/0/0/2/0/149